jgi:hypothetical protein
MHADEKLDGSRRTEAVFPTQELLLPPYQLLRGDKRLLHFVYRISQGTPYQGLIPETKLGMAETHDLDSSKWWIEKRSITAQSRLSRLFKGSQQLYEVPDPGDFIRTDEALGRIVQEFFPQKNLRISDEMIQPYVTSLFLVGNKPSAAFLRYGAPNETPEIVGGVGSRLLHLLKESPDLANNFQRNQSASGPRL